MAGQPKGISGVIPSRDSTAEWTEQPPPDDHGCGWVRAYIHTDPQVQEELGAMRSEFTYHMPALPSTYRRDPGSFRDYDHSAWGDPHPQQAA